MRSFFLLGKKKYTRKTIIIFFSRSKKKPRKRTTDELRLMGLLGGDVSTSSSVSILRFGVVAMKRGEGAAPPRRRGKNEKCEKTRVKNP